jgi:hypothetical protein
MNPLSCSYNMNIDRPAKGSCRTWCINFLLLLAVIIPAKSVSAQDTTIFLTLPDTAVYPGDSILCPINLTNMRDSIEAYSLNFTFSRPGLVEFLAEGIAPDTSVAFITEGTLTQEWDVTVGEFLGPVGANIRGISDLNLDHLPTGIPPLTLGEDLVIIVAHAICDPDTISGHNVTIIPAGLYQFSTPLGALILPVSATGAGITILPTAPGDLDHSGIYNVLDVVRIVNCAFRGSCPGCTNDLADLDCNGVVNVLDVVGLVNHVFRGGALPGCTP